MAVVGVASTGAQALRLAAELQPDVTLVDLDLGGESGLTIARQLSTATTPTHVVLISTHSEDDFAGLIAASPAIGFLPKAGLSASAIRKVLADSGDPAVTRESTRPSTG